MSRSTVSRARWLIVLAIALVAAMPAAGAFASPVIHVTQAQLKARGAAGLHSLANASSAVNSAAEQITGTAHLPGAYAADSQVSAVAYQYLIDPSGATSAYAWTVVADSQVTTAGTYAIDLPGPGTFRVGFTDPTGVYADAFYSNATTVGPAQDVVVATSTVVPNIDQTLTPNPEYIVSGQAHFVGATNTGNPVNIDVYTWDSAASTWSPQPSVLSNTDGSYRLHLSPSTVPSPTVPVNYKLGFSDPNGVFGPIFYANAANTSLATTVSITTTGTTAGVDVTMTAVPSSRVSGANVYETAANLSRDQFSDGVGGTVVLASGTAVGDSLTGSTFALAQGGPMLLTNSSGLPQVTIDEIKRLNPMTVVVVGGPPVIPFKQESQLRKLGVPIVRRIAGVTVFDTAAGVAQELVNTGLGGANGIAVASRDAVIDAVSGAAVAAVDGRPILFVTKNSIPAATQEFIDQNAPASTLVFGGPPVVSLAVRNALPGAVALYGTTAWDTSVAIAQYGIDNLGLNGRIVNLTSGDKNFFVEGAAAGPIAGARRQVTLLTPGAALNSSTQTFLHSRAGTFARISAIGGTNALSDATFNAAKLAITP